MVKFGIVAGLLLGVIAVASTPAIADEAKTLVSAAILLNMFATPIETREAAFDKSLRDSGPAPRPSLAGELLEDGSVRYGNAVVTVRNPCPPAALHYEPPPLPGRRARN